MDTRPSSPIFRTGLGTRLTDTQTKYCNPRCTYAPRVNEAKGDHVSRVQKKSTSRNQLINFELAVKGMRPYTLQPCNDMQIFAGAKEIFAVFIFTERLRVALTTPLPVDGHAPRANRRNDTERRSGEASLCNNGLVLLLCSGLHNCESSRTTAVGEK